MVVKSVCISLYTHSICVSLYTHSVCISLYTHSICIRRPLSYFICVTSTIYFNTLCYSRYNHNYNHNYKKKISPYSICFLQLLPFTLIPYPIRFTTTISFNTPFYSLYNHHYKKKKSPYPIRFTTTIYLPFTFNTTTYDLLNFYLVEILFIYFYFI